jgi:N-acetylmuramoyl-L-alanine amidase
VWVLVKVFLLFHLITLSPLTIAAKDFTLVIDAGHGGRDTGAVGKGKVKEKNLTLRYALAFGKMVEQNCPDVKVIYTRKTDTFVELYRRAEIANKNKADLFISIHINALPKGRVARGFQTYTLGTSKRTGKKTGVLENLEVAKRENSVILLEKNYKQTYQGYDPNSPESNIMFEFIQDKNMENSVELAKYMQKYVCQATGRQNMGAQQDNLAVLRLSSMPGCLVECGFISTSDEESFMNSDAAAGMYARGFFNAFQAYRKNHGGNKAINVQPQPQAKPAPAPVVPEPQLEVKPEPIQEAKPEPVQEVKPEPIQEAKPEPVQEAKPEVVPEAKPEIKPEPQKPVFKVQIFASSTLIKAGDARFKGLSGVGHYQEGGMYKYTVGDSSDYNAAIRLRKEIADKFPQAFIVAFKDGKRMDLNEAIGEFKKVKK